MSRYRDFNHDDFVLGVTEGLRREDLSSLIGSPQLNEAVIDVVVNLLKVIREALEKKRDEVRGFLGYGENAQLEGMEKAYDEMIQTMQNALDRAEDSRGDQ